MARIKNTPNKIISERNLNTLTSIKLEESIKLLNKILSYPNIIETFDYDLKCYIQDFINSYSLFSEQKLKREEHIKKRNTDKFTFLRELQEFEN